MVDSLGERWMGSVEKEWSVENVNLSALLWLASLVQPLYFCQWGAVWLEVIGRYVPIYLVNMYSILFIPMP